MPVDVIPHWTIWGRPVKSTAFGLAIIMLAFTVYNVTDNGLLRDSWLGDIVAITAAGSVALIAWGWWFRQERVSEYGLLGAAFTYLTRTLFVLLLEPHVEGVWIGIGVVVIAAGAYLKEVWSRDARDQ